MTPSRIAAVGALLVAIVAIVIVAIGGGRTHKYVLVFDDAGGLFRGNLVRVAGQQIGTVSDITVTPDLKAAVEIEIEKLGPLRKGTAAQIRAMSLSGVANKYIALSLAPNDAPALADGARITDARGITGQDELVNAFDEPTREGLRQVFKGSADTVAGRSEDLQKAISNAPGALKELSEFSDDLEPNGGALRDVVTQLAAINNALADRSESITSLVRSSGTAARAAAADGDELAEAVARAPKAMEQANQVLAELPGTLNAFERLLTETDRNDAGLPATLDQLSDTLNEGEDTIGALARTFNRKGDDNDVADLLKAAVPLGEASESAAKTVPEGLAAATPLMSDTRAYTPDIISALTSLGLVSANYDAAGHYLRLAPVLNLFELAGGGEAQDLVPRASFNNRLQGYRPAGNRCPGSAAQTAPDGSAPFTDGGNVFCDPSATP